MKIKNQKIKNLLVYCFKAILPLYAIFYINLTKISTILYIETGVLNTFYIQSIGSGFVIYSGLFHSQIIQLLSFYLSLLILFLEKSLYFSLELQSIYILTTLYSGLFPIGIRSYSNSQQKVKKSKIKNRLMGIIKEMKIGWNMTKEPEWLIDLNSKIYFKIFRVLGSLCVVLVMSGIAKEFHMLIKYYIVIIILIFSLLRLYIAIYFIWQFIANVYYGKLIVRNSPINLASTFVKVLSNGLRSAAGISVGTGFTYALFYELDDILISEGKKPYFVPGLKAGIRRVGVDQELIRIMKWAGIQDMANVADKPRSAIQILDSLKPEERVEMEKLANKPWQEIYNNAKLVGDVIGDKVPTSVKNKLVKDLTEGVEKDDIFKELTEKVKGKDTEK